jgi:zinc protease
MVRRSLCRLSCALAVAFVVTQGAVPATQAQKVPTAREIVDRFVKASGGEAALQAIKSMRVKGTFSIVGQSLGGDLEMMSARPNKLLMRVSIPAIGTVEEGFDGKVGWSINPLEGPSLVTDRQLSERADEAWFDAELHKDDYVKEMSVVGRESLDKRDVYRVKVITLRGNEQFELYDVDNGLQVAVEASRDTPLGIVPSVVLMKEYQKFGAVLMPTRVVQRVLGQEHVFAFSSYEFDSVPANTFDLPATIKALIKK